MPRSIAQCFKSFTFFAILTSALILFAVNIAGAQCPVSVVAGGLQSPVGITQSKPRRPIRFRDGPGGTELETQFDCRSQRQPANITVRIALCDRFEGRLFRSNGTLYARPNTIRSDWRRQFHSPWGFPGAELPNPNPASPLFSSILAIHISAHAEAITTGFTLTAQQQQALAQGEKVTLSSGAGDKIQIELIVNFPSFVDNPNLPPPFVIHSIPSTWSLSATKGSSRTVA